ncbi:MAG: hypothetical protein CO162_04140, partial [bacterium (Candidatus Ratteibacteria) CG_4_9_14_3_um_filter_41_21]
TRAKFLYGISKFPLTYVSSPQGERMEVRGLIYCQRGFCRLFCPLGAIFSLFNGFSLLKPKAKGCPIKICKNPDSFDCIRCLDCVKK